MLKYDVCLDNFSQRCFRIIAGLPPAITFAGIDLVTTELFPIMLLLPISTPFNILTLEPIKTFSPIITFAVFGTPPFFPLD